MPSLYSRGSEHEVKIRRVWETVNTQWGCHTWWKRRWHCSNGRCFFLQRASHDVGAHSGRHRTCTSSVCQHVASALCRLFGVSLSRWSLCLLSLLQHLSVGPPGCDIAGRTTSSSTSPKPWAWHHSRFHPRIVFFYLFFTWSVPFCSSVSCRHLPHSWK